MWSDFVSSPIPALTVSQRRFQRMVLTYLEGQPTLNGLLTHIPTNCIVRVYVEENQLKIQAINAPETAILFEAETFYAIQQTPEHPALTREELDIPYPFQLSPRDQMALAFFYTKANHNPMAGPRTSVLVPLDFIRLKDLVHTDQILLDVSFTLSAHRRLHLVS